MKFKCLNRGYVAVKIFNRMNALAYPQLWLEDYFLLIVYLWVIFSLLCSVAIFNAIFMFYVILMLVKN